MRGSIAWVRVSRTSWRTSSRSQPRVILQHRLADLLEAAVVGAESLEPELADPRADQRAPVQQAVGVELWPERHERRLRDDRFVQVKEGRAHAFMLGVARRVLRAASQ